MCGALTLRTAALAGDGAPLEISDTGQGVTLEKCERPFLFWY